MFLSTSHLCLLIAASLSQGPNAVLGEAHPSFGYDGEMGPQHWANSYATCAGKFQSPIDIEEHLVKMVKLPPLQFRGFKPPSHTTILTNNGHTVMLQLNTSEPASVTGGPLKGSYVFAQLHFHWGTNDSVGSEDTINNHTFPMELHMVLFKEDYGNAEKAMAYKDGLVVLAVFYEVYHKGENPVYSEIVASLPNVVQPNSRSQLKMPVVLDSLLPETRHLYFTYNGSLTTPPCSEVVTWIDFKQPVLLSPDQVGAFRNLKSQEGLMTHNFRPTQPLSGRTVLFNVGDIESKGSVFLAFSSVTFLTAMLAYFILSG